MKSNKFFTCILLPILFGWASGGEQEESEIIQQYDISLEEVQKILTIRLTEDELKSGEVWGGVDPSKLPKSMAEIVVNARNQLKKWGADPDLYFLKACSLVRAYRVKELNLWYWEVVFCDTSFPASVYPVITIPVLLSGKVPNVTPDKGAK